MEDAHAISIAEPPALPQRRACLGPWIVAVGVIWCIATVGMAIAFVVTGRTVTEYRAARLSPIVRSVDMANDVTRRVCYLKLRITDGEATLAEVGAALALSIGNSINVDTETSLRDVGRCIVAVRFAKCDPSLENMLGGTALQQSWSANINRMRGAQLIIIEGPEVLSVEEANAST